MTDYAPIRPILALLVLPKVTTDEATGISFVRGEHRIHSDHPYLDALYAHMAPLAPGTLGRWDIESGLRLVRAAALYGYEGDDAIARTLDRAIRFATPLAKSKLDVALFAGWELRISHRFVEAHLAIANGAAQ